MSEQKTAGAPDRKNPVEEMIENLYGTVTMMRAQVIYGDVIMDQVLKLIKEDPENLYAIRQVITKIIQGIVAEAYIEGKTAAVEEIDKRFFQMKAEISPYDSHTVKHVMNFISISKETD
tara:strand:- start:80726 stop:81082 length:357 start_codon:yes stop_codon:yes gene_type:complete